MAKQPQQNPNLFKFLVNAYYDTQDIEIKMNNQLQSRLRDERISNTEKEELEAMSLKRFRETKNDILKQIKRDIKAYPIWNEWLKDVKGIGETIAAVLISEILFKRQARYYDENGTPSWGPHPDNLNADNREAMLERFKSIYGEPTDIERSGIECFDSPANLIAFAGLHNDENGNAVRRKKGQQANWSNFVKTKVLFGAECIVKNGVAYRALYDEYREQEAKKDITPNHAYRRALRRVAKVFLNHVWTVARLQRGLAVEAPYPLQHPETIPNHKSVHYIPPLRDSGDFPESWKENWRDWGPYPIWLDDRIRQIRVAKENKRKAS